MFRFLSKGRQSATPQQVGIMPDLDEMERKAQSEEEIQRRRTQTEALQQAQRKNGPLKLGDLEAQLKRISEEVTIEAAYKKKDIKPS